MFEALHKGLEAGDTRCVPVDASHVVARGFDAERLTVKKVAVLGYEVPRGTLLALVFIRQGQSLVSEPVSAAHDSIWRIGVTVADLAGLLDSSYSDLSMRLTSLPFVYGRGDRTGWANETILRTSLYKLRACFKSQLFSQTA